MIDVRIQKNKFSLIDLLDLQTPSSHGAQSVFSGIVRNHNHGKKVLGVSYDAFAPLAHKEFEKICREAQARFGSDLQIQLWHRIGRLDVGDLSVAIIVSSKHRDEAFKANRYIIEELKNRAPIWKMEHYEDGNSAWLKGHALCSHSNESLNV